MMNLSPIETPYTTTSTAALAHSATAFVPATGAASMGSRTAITGSQSGSATRYSAYGFA